MTGTALLVHSQSSPSFLDRFPSSNPKIKPNVVCQVLDGYALTYNKGDSNGKTLIGWVLYNYFRTLIMAAFLGGLLMGVQLM